MRIQKLKNDTLVVNSYYLIIANLTNAVGGYLFWIIAARRFDDVTIGLSAAIISAMGLIDLVTNFGFGSGLIRFLPHQSTQVDGNQLISAVKTYRLLMILFGTVVFILGIPYWSPALVGVTKKVDLLLAFVVMVLSNGLFLMSNSIFISMRKAVYVLNSGLVFNFIKLLAVLLMPVTLGAFGLVLSTAAALLFVAIIQEFKFLPAIRDSYRPQLRICFPNIKPVILYSFHNQIADTLFNLPQMLLPLLILNYLGPRANAVFYTSWMTASMLRTVSLSISQSTFAEGVADPQFLRQKLVKGLSIIMFTLFLGGGFLVLAAPYLLMLFGKSYSDQGRVILQWFVASTIFVSPISIYFTALRTRGKTMELIILAVIWVLISLSAAALGILSNDLSIFAKAWTIGQGISLVATSIYFFRYRIPLLKKI